MVLCNTITPSIMFLPSRNVVWGGLMTFLAILNILFVVTLVNILNLTFSRQISLYYCIVAASLHLGSRIMVLKLRLYRGKSPLWNSRNKVIFIISQHD
jgi:hypothetical protein